MLTLLFLCHPLCAAAFFDDHGRGWHWYEVVPPPIENDEEAKPLTSADRLKEYRERLEETLATAILTPTPKNVRLYQEQQLELMAKSKAFATFWLQNLIIFPGLDHTAVFPISHTARHIYLDQLKEATSQTIKKLAQNYGLFFFASSNCAYCHKFAPIVKEFAAHYQWEVLAISLDGGEIPGFAAVLNNGLAQQWNVTAVPALYAVNPQNGTVLPLANGFASYEQIEERIMTLVR